MTIEEMQEALTNREAEYNDLKVKYDALEAQASEDQKRIKELEEYNRKLFMKIPIGSTAKEKEEPNLEDQILKDFKGRL